MIANNNMPIYKVLDRLELKQQTSANTWRAKCPVHQSEKSRSRTLWVKENDNGSVGVHCHAGCQFDDILGSINLQRSDLFPSDNYIRSFNQGNHKPRPNYRMVVENVKDPLMHIHVILSHIEKHPNTPKELDLEEQDLIILRGALTRVEEVLHASAA